MTGAPLASGNPHSRLMDNVYRHQRHIYDATRKYYLLGRDRLISGLELRPGQSLLEVGCGTGRNLAVIARRYPASRLFGLDISGEMLDTARAKLAARPGSVTLKQLDANQFLPGDFDEDGFDRIMISYALSMIPDWRLTVATSLAALNPGGSLHIADFGQQEGLPRWFGHALRAWLHRFHVTPRADLESVLRAMVEGTPYGLEFTRHARGYSWLAVITRI
ncbi:MAG: class I SAM-dependent methyltransferase [Rhizobium sp.]|nr:class I SAM-dependent methyltransferase [Rhizobium sp.]